MGHRQNNIAPDVTPQNAASHLGLFFLHREISSKMRLKIKTTSNIPKNESRLTHMIMMGESNRQIWVKGLPSVLEVNSTHTTTIKNVNRPLVAVILQACTATHVVSKCSAMEGCTNVRQRLKTMKLDMSHLVGKPTMWFPSRSDTNRPVQA